MSREIIKQATERILNCSECGAEIEDYAEYLIIEVQSADNTKMAITTPRGLWIACKTCAIKGIPDDFHKRLHKFEEGVRPPHIQLQEAGA